MRFEFIAGALCLDFANTIHDLHADDKREELHAISDLLQWAVEARLLSSTDHHSLATHYERNPRAAAASLAEAIAVRDLLVSIFAGIANGSSVSPQRLSALNSALAQARWAMPPGDAPEDHGSGLLNGFQTLAQEIAVSMPKLDVVLVMLGPT
jgi:predicted RNA-binding Zn ribbon-like protein